MDNDDSFFENLVNGLEQKLATESDRATEAIEQARREVRAASTARQATIEADNSQDTRRRPRGQFKSQISMALLKASEALYRQSKDMKPTPNGGGNIMNWLNQELK